MIKSKTVFILGAGFSKLYGYPTGIELRQEIINNCHPKGTYLLEKGISKNIIEAFKNTFAYSRCSSIDQFIALTSKDDFKMIARFLVEKIIMERENEKMLFPSEHTPLDSIWNHILYSDGKLTTNANDLCENHISFINFNYDRVLEYYLFTVLRQTFILDPGTAGKLVDNFNICHVYGMLKHPETLTMSLCCNNTMGDIPHDSEIYELSKHLSYIRANEELEFDDKMCNLISNAQNIVILGFGFDDFNMKKLKLGEFKAKRIFASGKGINKARQKTIEYKLLGAGDHNVFEDDQSDLAIINTLDKAWLEIY